MTPRTKELMETRAGRWVSKYIDSEYKKRKKKLRDSGKLEELMDEANDIEKSIVRDANQAFYDKNPLFLEMLREFNSLRISTEEIVNYELGLFVDAELREEIDVFDVF